MAKRPAAPERIRTGGNAFDPDERHIYFLASNGATVRIASEFHKHILVATNDLMTSSDDLDYLLDAGCKVFLDSGIFWLTNQHKRAHGITMDQALALPPDAIDGFNELFERYVHLVTTYGDRLWGYVELDQGGMENKRRTRQRLHDLGLRPIPVYHPKNDGWDYFDELAETHDRICFGNIVQASAPVRDRLVSTAWERHRLYPDLYIHMLGLTPNERALAYWSDSADSSSWLTGIRWSKAYREQALLKRISNGMQRDFIYRLGDGNHHSKAVAAYAMASHFLSITWAEWRDLCDEVLDGEDYPPLAPGETDRARR